MKQSTTILASNEAAIESQVKRFCVPLFILASFYPIWARIHYWVDSTSLDSVGERLAIYGVVLLTIFIALFTHLRPEWKLSLLKVNRWLFVGHYFILTSRNHVSIPYAMVTFFLTFHTSGVFERPRNFLYFAAFALAMSLTCVSQTPFLPTFFFRTLIAFSLFLSGAVMFHRYKLTQAIRTNEKMLRDMFETAGVGMALLDLSGKIIAANQALAAMLALPIVKIEGKRLEEFSTDPDEPFETDLEKLIKREISALNVERSFRAGSGFVWGKLSASLITSTSSFVLVLVEDISRQKASELLVRDRQEKLYYSARMAALGEMAGGIAHEINNPLAVIDVTASVLNARLAANELDVAFARESLSSIQRMTDRAAKIIRGLRSFSRDGSGDPVLPFTVRELLQGALDLCDEKAKARNVILHIAKSPLDYVVSCRGVEVSQVFLNLLNNAFDAVGELPERWVRVEIEPEPNFIRIDISNSGPPIPADLREKIFQPFFTTKPVGQGVGLGLSISLGLMVSQGGKLALDLSKPNTCFSTWIPRETPHARAVIDEKSYFATLQNS